MIQQSLVDERVSALHHHTLHSPGDNDGDMSKATSRRVPAPVTSRIVIKKNSSLLPIGDETRQNSPLTSPTLTPTVDPRSRVELLERNLRYVQQQHEITLTDLHREISRLQQENRDLHFRMIDIHPQSPSINNRKNTEIAPNIHQLADLVQSEPILEKRLQEIQRLHFEQQIDELQTRLIESEQKNEYLIRTIDELNKKTLVQSPQPSSSVVPVLLPDPNTSVDANLTTNNNSKIINSEQTQITDSDYQHLLKSSHEKQRQQIQEIARLRAVLREILHAERLSSTSKILVRDCLASTNINENLHITATTTPVDVLYNIGNRQQLQQRSLGSSSTGGKALSLRHELPLRRLNLSPPQFIAPRSTGQNRPMDQRLVLPPIIQSASPASLQDPTGASGLLYSSLSQTNAGSQHQLLKFGETPVARRERRTQELQRTRLTRNLYH